MQFAFPSFRSTTNKKKKPAVRERRKRLAEESSDDESDDELEVPDDLDVGADASREMAEAKLAYLAVWMLPFIYIYNLQHFLITKKTMQHKQGKEDEAEENGGDLQDEDDYTSPLDDIDELKYFLQTIESALLIV